MQLRAAGLGDDLQHAAIHAAVLRLIGCGLHLDFLDEGQIDACSERTIDRAEYAEAAVTGVVQHDAVDQVEIFKTGRATD